MKSAFFLVLLLVLVNVFTINVEGKTMSKRYYPSPDLGKTELRPVKFSTCDVDKIDREIEDIIDKRIDKIVEAITSKLGDLVFELSTDVTKKLSEGCFEDK